MAAPRVVIGYDKVVADFVSSQIPGGMNFQDGMYVGLGVVKDGKLIAGVVYSEYRDGVDIRESFASISPSWATKNVLRALFHYPFEQLKVVRLTGVVAASNERSISLTERLGFVREGLLRKAMPNGDDAIIYGMLKEECKWLA